MSFRFLDLFCGCGGFTQGFKQAGFIPSLGIDMWNDATTTYKFNFPESQIINDDITKVSVSDILNVANIEAADVDVIIGGPPCQGFSISGKRMIDDPRNVLYKAFVTLVGKIQPKVFVMENVPGLISMANGLVKDSVIEDFSLMGYNVAWKILTADNYGVPQNRRRVFFVGLNKNYFGNLFFEFPAATTEKDKVTCYDAISDLDFIPDDVALPEMIDYSLPAINDYQLSMRKNSTHIWNHVVTLHNEKTKRIIAMVPDGGNYLDLPKELRSTRKVHIAWTRMNSRKPCFTIDTGHNHHFHYKENRVPTVRESARIQSFPDSFVFAGTDVDAYRQIGNAIPPVMFWYIAKAVAKLLLDQAL